MRKIYTVALLLLASHTILFSQTIPIRGKVKSDDGSPFASVTVQVKGAKTVTTTDQKGEFSVAVPKLPVTLVFSTIGYETKELVVKKKDSTKYLSVRLHPSEHELAEVVVIGYGTSSRRDVTGSVPAIEGRMAGISSRKRGEEISKSDPGLHTKRVDDARKGFGFRAGDWPKGARSRVLTAGELSDFKKWKLWEGYSIEEFKQWSEHWGISPVSRYCLQVQNSDRKAIAGEKVYLINLNSYDTVWRTITDNTGKAELWANFHPAENEQGTYAIACGDQTLRFPTIFENGINRITLKKECAQSNTADIAFVVDATGSMGDEILYMQEELQDVIGNISAKNKSMSHLPAL